MRFVTFEHRGEAHAGVLVESHLNQSHVVSLKSAGYGDLISVLRGGDGAIDAVEGFLPQAPQQDLVPLAEARLLAPIPNPPKILCMGLNYRDHAMEAKMEIPKAPTIFAKYNNTIIGPGDDIVLPRNSAKPDYEAEFAFVIGRGGRHIKAEDWRAHVFGYMNLNDVSARDFQMSTSQWTMGKNFDTFAPMGPWLLSADEVEDPHNLDISLSINGETLQRSNTRELIFKIPETLEFLSSVMTLEPGDIISTGTPAGVGFSHRPPRWLKPGDEIVVEVTGLGQLRNRCVAEA